MLNQEEISTLKRAIQIMQYIVDVEKVNQEFASPMYKLTDCLEGLTPLNDSIRNLMAFATSLLKDTGILTKTSGGSLRFTDESLNAKFNVPNSGTFKVNEEGKEYIRTQVCSLIVMKK